MGKIAVEMDNCAAETEAAKAKRDNARLSSEEDTAATGEGDAAADAKAKEEEAVAAAQTEADAAEADASVEKVIADESAESMANETV